MGKMESSMQIWRNGNAKLFVTLFATLPLIVFPAKCNNAGFKLQVRFHFPIPLCRWISLFIGKNVCAHNCTALAWNSIQHLRHIVRHIARPRYALNSKNIAILSQCTIGCHRRDVWSRDRGFLCVYRKIESAWT